MSELFNTVHAFNTRREVGKVTSHGQVVRRFPPPQSKGGGCKLDSSSGPQSPLELCDPRRRRHTLLRFVF